jgi:hypothetical protein
MRYRRTQNACPRKIAGTATLELVFCMPILLAIIVGIVWLGSSVIAQTEVTVQARHKTWNKRDNPTGTALLFLNDDIETDDAKKTVQISPIFDDTESPEASHDVMVGAWDFQQLPLDQAPNWKQYAIAAANAKSGSLQTNYTDAQNDFTNFKNQASNIWRTLGADLIRQLTSLGNSASRLLETGEAEESAEKSNERRKIKRDLKRAKAELEKAREALRAADEDASKALKDVLKNRIKRLKADVKDLEDDLEAIE